MTADYSVEIKIAIFQSISECQGDEWRSSSNFGQIAAKIACFNSVNSEIIGWKFTKFVHDIARLLPFKLLKADIRSANPLSNAEAKSKGRSWQCQQTSPKFNCCHSNVPWATVKQILWNHPHQYAYQTCEVCQDRYRIFWDIWRDMPIFAVSQQKVLLLTA